VPINCSYSNGERILIMIVRVSGRYRQKGYDETGQVHARVSRQETERDRFPAGCSHQRRRKKYGTLRTLR